LERTRPPESTQEMINLGEYMLNVKNKFMNTLKEEIECSKGHLLYLIDVHIFSKEDINLNTTTLAWPQKIKPVFEQNTELVEDCKARLTVIKKIKQRTMKHSKIKSFFCNIFQTFYTKPLAKIYKFQKLNKFECVIGTA
jgi:hypothetical protein